MSLLAVALLDAVALVGATVHSFTDDRPAAVATVLIVDGLIAEVGPELVLPEGTRTIDVAGLHLIPGLVDAVVSFDAEHDPLYLAAGVTLVRDHGSPYGRVLEEQGLALRDRNPGPSLLVTGPPLGGASLLRVDAVALPDAERARLYMERTLETLIANKQRPDAFALDGSIGADALRVVGRFAAEVEAPLWGGRPRELSLEEARARGQRGLLGLDSVLPAGATWMQDEELPDLAPTVRALAQGGWAVAPLLYGTARVLREPGDEDDTLVAHLSPTLEMAWRADASLFLQNAAQGGTAVWQRALERQRKFVRQLYEAGVTLVPATGAPAAWLAPGGAVALELREWVAAGIPVQDVLRLATRGAAEALGQGDVTGRVAPGLRADLVLLGSDPRVSLAALQSPEMVVVRGRVLERFEIEEQLASLATQQAEVRAQLARSPELELPDMPEGELLLAGQADTLAYGLRLSTERFAVVKLADGAMAYGARIEVPASASETPRRLHLVQTIRDGLVESFELHVGSSAEVESGAEEESSGTFYARGRRLPNERYLKIERRLGGALIDSSNARERITLIDMSTIVSGLIVARHFPEDASYVLAFEGATLEAAVDRWRMRVRPEDNRIDVLTSRGFLAFGFAADGVPQFGFKRQGSAALELGPVRAEVRGGGGFGLDTTRVFRAVEASAPKDGAPKDGAPKDGAQKEAKPKEQAREGAGASGGGPSDDGRR